MQRCDRRKSSTDGRSICDAELAFAITTNLKLIADREPPTIDRHGPRLRRAEAQKQIASVGTLGAANVSGAGVTDVGVSTGVRHMIIPIAIDKPTRRFLMGSWSVPIVVMFPVDGSAPWVFTKRPNKGKAFS